MALLVKMFTSLRSPKVMPPVFPTRELIRKTFFVYFLLNSSRSSGVWFPLETQLNPGNLTYFQGKLKLLRVIGVSSCFEQKYQKHLIKEAFCLYLFYCKISSNVRILKRQNKKTKQNRSMKTTRMFTAKSHLNIC